MKTIWNGIHVRGRCVSGGAGSAGGQIFTGAHGDGALDSATGNADVNAWPGDSNGSTAGGTVSGATGPGFRGGAWNDSSSNARVSVRGLAAYTGTGRSYVSGFRCSRTSP